jgi:hypothetical protein
VGPLLCGGVFKSPGFRLAAAVSVDLIAAYFSDMSEVEPPEQPQGHFDDAVYVMREPAAPEGDETAAFARGGRGRKGAKNPKNQLNQTPQGGHLSELQELRGKLAEHEEMMGKLRAAFGMISAALDLRRPAAYSSVDDASSFLDEDAVAHRPARLSRRGGANCFNTAHYKNNNRGGSANFNNSGRFNSNNYNNNNANCTPLGNGRRGGYRGP